MRYRMRYSMIILNLIVMLIFSNANAIQYLLPDEFDDVKASVTSSGTVIIDMSSPPSNNRYPVSDGSTTYQVRYKCYVSQKINCKLGTPHIYAFITGYTLLDDNNESVSSVAQDIIVEDDGAFRICVMLGGNDGIAYLTQPDSSPITPSSTNRSKAIVTFYQECK